MASNIKHRTSAPSTLTWQWIGILLLGRFVNGTAFRLVYPLLAFLAASFAVDLQTASLLVTVQVSAALISPLGGILADLRGERETMLWGLALFCVGTAICALAPVFGLFLLGYTIIGIGSTLYVPAVASYASARSDYARRGRVLGILELSWALSALIGVAGLTRLVETSNARASAFWVLLAVGLVALALTLFALPGGPRSAAGRKDTASRINLAVLANPSVAAALLMLFLTLCSVETIFVVYAGWLQSAFSATTEQLGLIFGLIGIVEIGGSLSSALFVDRFGKRRMVLLGFFATALMQLLLPLSAGNWFLFLPLFLTFMLFFELAIVSALPLLSGLAPQSRGAVLAFSVTCIGLGRVVGSLIGPPIWLHFGFLANGLLAGCLALLAVAFCWRFVREGER